LGPFIGQDSYAYQFYHQGDKVDFKTKTGWLNSMVRYKKVVVLIDENSQSTAEVTAAALKKYNVGAIVGTTTKGWGTVERVIPLDNQIAKDEKYSIFLVHHVTLRDDGMPIEGRGVDPQISIKDPNWKKELMERFNDAELVKAVEEIYK
jgi:C-terminal processing protease CtpA/Prc